MQFEIKTTKREDLVDISARIDEIVLATGVSEGVVVVSSPHTTAGVTVNENADPDVVRDILTGLERVIPRQGGWRHFEGNSDAHLKTAVVGSSVTVPVERGLMVLGTWQAVYLAEFDGPRTRHVAVTVLAGVAR